MSLPLGFWRSRRRAPPCAKELPEMLQGLRLHNGPDWRLPHPCLAIRGMDFCIDGSLAAMLSASLTTSGLGAVIDAQQAAALLGCSEGHIDRLAEGGRLPGRKYGRGWVFVTAQLLHHVVTESAENVRPVAEAPGEPGTTKHEGGQPASPPTGLLKRRGRPRRPLLDLPDFSQAALPATVSETDPLRSRMSASSEPRKLK
jgi:hypothetical protein